MNKDCNCNKSFSTFTEYPCKQQACIKERQPDCTATAVIPSITVENADGSTNLANCFVHVVSNNTTYYVDDRHRVMLVWSGPMEVLGYDVETNPLGLRSQLLFTASTAEGPMKMVYYDKQGNAHQMAEEE